jgi:hypothetical protein
MKTVREQIIERIIAQLETITISNGYHNDIGCGHVYRQIPIMKNNYAPAVSIWELSESRERNRYGGTVRTLNIKIEAVVQTNGYKHPSTVSNELLGDIEKALIIGDTTLDELIDDIQDIAADINYPLVDEKSSDLVLDAATDIISLPVMERKLAGATIDFEIKYTTEWGDPYSHVQW